MIIKTLDEMTQIQIDLSSQDGNAFALMSKAQSFYKQLGKDPRPLIKEMAGGDYNNLLEVFEREFGDFVTLIK